MATIRWTEERTHYESLAVCLRAILATFDRSATYEELTAALGLGFATVACRNDSLGWWCTHGRDTALESVAAFYGLRLRDLHPPKAARFLAESDEFPQHFRDSYTPIIRHAIEHGQAVLAWRGWPAPRDRLWGVITEARNEMLIGYSLWHGGQPLPLVSAAHQVYIVEACATPSDPAPLSVPELFGHVRCQAISVWNDSWTTHEELSTGAAAIDEWIGALRTGDDAKHEALPHYRRHGQAARVFVAARRHLATWLREIGDALSTDEMRQAAHWANSCDQTADTLDPFSKDEDLEALFGQSGRVESICEALEKIKRLDGGTIEVLQQH